MKVSRIEAFGFKSFMDRVVIPLGGGITGIVGPNGCGKSNVVDALRWVMGETRASLLRGGVLEDVIFNGSEKHRPLGLAEVSVVLRADLDSLLADIEALPGSSPEAPVSSPANTDEVTANTNQGSDGGETTEATAPEVTEESQQESKSASVATGGSLGRSGWLGSVREVQVTRRLYRSGESEYYINKVLCRLKDVREFFRAVGLGARGYTIIAQGEIGRIVTAKPEDRRILIEEAAHVAGFREQITTVSRRLEESGESVARLDDVIKEVTRQVGGLRRQAARAIARVELKAELKECDTVTFQHHFRALSEKLEQLCRSGTSDQEQQVALETRLHDTAAGEAELRAGVGAVEQRLGGLRSLADAKRNEINQQVRERSRIEGRVRELKSTLQARESELGRLDERRSLLAERLKESTAEVARLEQEEARLIEEQRNVDTGGEAKLRQISEELSKKRDELKSKERAIRDVRDRMVSAQARYDALSNQLVAASPAAELRKRLKNQPIVQDLGAEAKLLVDGVRVDGQHGKVLQAILAEKAGFLVSAQPFQLGRAFASHLASQNQAGKQRSAIGILRSSGAPEEEKAAQQRPDLNGLPSLLSRVSTESWCAETVNTFLADVFVADSLEAAFVALEKLPEDEADFRRRARVVTLDGDIVSWDMVFSLRHDGGLVQMKVQIDEAVRLLAENRTVYESAAGERDAVAQQVTNLEAQYSEVLRYTQQCQARLREISSSLGGVRGKMQAERRLAQQVSQDIERMAKQRSDGEGQLTVLRNELGGAEQRLAALPEKVDAELQAQLDELLKSIETGQAELQAGWKGVDQRRSEADELRRTLDRLRRAENERLLQQQRVQFELNRHCEKMTQEYSDEFRQALEKVALTIDSLPSELLATREQRAQEIRTRIHREGEVDPSSVEQCEIEEDRLRDLVKQKEDLQAAAKTLQATLTELTEACRARFLETFNSVREKFKEFAPQLYGGGSGDMVLLDPERPLESGVEISVRPPGKKLKSIDLLSGGEKALCAIALVFALFMSRPSPMCVLDEVDAPLDEANVQRFLAFIRSLSQRTQFLMITHNKASMAASDTLMGVTMQEPGVTKTLSVSLTEAERHAA
jgi:chromosome segregation protein